MTPRDSTGQPLAVGNSVIFRGCVYTIKEFHHGEARNGTARIEFIEPQHTVESADEVSVDLVGNTGTISKTTRDADFVQQMIDSPNDDTIPQVYADYLSECGQDGLAELLKKLDDLIGSRMKKNLVCHVIKDTSYSTTGYSTTGSITVGHNVQIKWCGVTVAEFYIPAY